MKAKSSAQDIVVRALSRPQELSSWSLSAWAELVRRARVAGLLGRIDGLNGAAPAQARKHFESAARLGLAQRAEVLRELAFIRRALDGLGHPVVVLKGAAYVLAGLPAAQGRVFSDIDILVPKSAIAEVESRLMLAGWAGTTATAYDQRYYRQWMHELPPMQHMHRQTALDVHHTILPETARLKPPAALLFDAARSVAGDDFFLVLAAEDMLLHSMTHLFMNEDMHHGLRDLSDLDLLLRHFGADPGFWDRLLTRAQALDLVRPLFYGLHMTTALLGTPVPQPSLKAVAALGPAWPLRPLMTALWRRVLSSKQAPGAGWVASLAQFFIYVRGHWLRMPVPLLVRHLGIKALGLHERGLGQSQVGKEG